MKPSEPYTDELDYDCAECGFCVKSDVSPETCPACGARALSLGDACLAPLRNFVSGALVELPNGGLWVAKVPVTQMLWRVVAGRNPSRFRGDELPVESVSQTDCLDFVERLNRQAIVANAGYVFRLPTSAEWTSFARRGRRKFCNVAWTWSDSDLTTHPVASKRPNPLGLYDLWGNVWEWCSDVDEAGAVCRGGCWCCDEDGCSLEDHWPVDTRRSFIGLRLCAERI